MSELAREPRARRAITSQRVLLIAVPVVFANAATPIQGAVDTAVIGNLGQVAMLAGVGLGAEIFALLFGSFNFLQIGASGLSAQALGEGAHERLLHTLIRGLMIALVIATGLILLQAPILWGMLSIFEASAEAEALTAAYFGVRIWAAPAELGVYALLGWFAGQEQMHRLVGVQIAIALLNITLSLWFVLLLGWGVEGVAFATVCAEYCGLFYGLYLARRRWLELLPADWRPDRARLLNSTELWRLMALNRDIFIRTMLLIAAFTWMARQGSILGDDVLAANVVLWHLFIISAFGLDGFAIAAETLVGQTIGERDVRRLVRAVWLTSIWAFVLSALVSAVFVVLSGSIIDLFTTAPAVRALARDYALWAALIPLAGVLAFQMDGVFVGATGSVEMRNAMIFSSLLYFPLSWWATLTYGNTGIWAAVWAWLIIRGLSLLLLYPSVRARAMAPPEPASTPAH